MSVKNFEEITEDLTENEMFYVEDVKQAILTKLLHAEFRVSQEHLANYVNNYLRERHGLWISINITAIRIRKYFNYFRSNGIIPIIATSSGCCLAKTQRQIDTQVESLRNRANQINKAADGMANFNLEKFHEENKKEKM